MSLLDSSIAALQNAMTSISTTTGDWSDSWESAKNNLIAKAGEFSELYNSLRANASVALSDPALAAQYQSLMSKGDYLKSTVSTITGSFDIASDWFNNIFATVKNAVGLGAVPLKLNYGAIARRAGMGFIQIVPVAVIALAAAAIVAWLSEAYQLKQKLDYVKGTSTSGGERQSILNSLFGSGGTVGDSAKAIGVLAVGGIVLYLAWPYLKRLQK